MTAKWQWRGLLHPAGMLTSSKTLKRARSWLRWDLVFCFRSYSNLKNIFFLSIYHRDIKYRIRWAVNINCCKFINLTLSLLIFNLLRSSKLLNANLLLTNHFFRTKFSQLEYVHSIWTILLYHFCLRIGWASSYIKNNVGIRVRLVQCKSYSS